MKTPFQDTLPRSFRGRVSCFDNGHNGRNAVPPIHMFKYLLLKSIFDLSYVDVVERSNYDMSLKYFLDRAPEDEVINPSSFTKFRKLRMKDKFPPKTTTKELVDELDYCQKVITAIEKEENIREYPYIHCQSQKNNDIIEVENMK